MGDFKEIVKTMTAHPIATIFIVDALAGGVATIIKAVRGDRHIGVDELKQIIADKPVVTTE